MVGKADNGTQVWWFDSEDAVYDAEAIVDPLIGNGTLAVYQPRDTNKQAECYIDFLQFTEKVVRNAKDGDWVMVDKSDILWKWTQQYYVQEVKHQNMTERLRELAEQGKTGWAAFSGVIERSEWGNINALHDALVQPLVMRSSDRPTCHLGFVTEVADIEDDDGFSSPNGVRPTGQKGLPYMMRTLVTLEAGRAGHTYSTQERHGSGRKNVLRVPFENFALKYLVQEHGWTLKPKVTSSPTDPAPTPGGSSTPLESEPQPSS